MRVLVNAVSIKEGGALTVLKKLLPAMAMERPDIEWIVAVNPKAGTVEGPRSITQFEVQTDRSPAHLLSWYEWGLAAALRQHAADVLFSTTNYLPHRSIKTKSLLLVQHAGHFSPEYERLRREAAPSFLSSVLWSQKTNWVRASVMKSDVLTVQTAALADAVAAQTRRPRSTIAVVPHGPGWVEPRGEQRFVGGKTRWRIGCVSTWSFHKNFLTLLRAVRIVADAGWAITLVLTVDPALPQVQQLFFRASEMDALKLMENHGVVNGSDVSQIYDSIDIFAFPSVCESFGMPMVEAMARGIPLIVAKTPENIEISGEGTLSFGIYDAQGLAQQLILLMSDQDLLEAQARRSLSRGRNFSWKSAAQGTLQALELAADLHGGRKAVGQRRAMPA